MVEGRSYAYREKRTAGSEPLKVKLIEKVRRKVKLEVRFETGPHPGLEDYVATRQIVVPSGEAKRFLRDEEREAQVEEEFRKATAS